MQTTIIEMRNGSRRSMEGITKALPRRPDNKPGKRPGANAVVAHVADGSDDEDEPQGPSAVPTDYNCGEAKVWEAEAEAKAKIVETNRKHMKEEDLPYTCGKGGHFSEDVLSPWERSETSHRDTDGDGSSRHNWDRRHDSESGYERESSYRDKGHDRDGRNYSPRSTPCRSPGPYEIITRKYVLSGDGEHENEADNSEASSDAATNAKLDMLLDRWRAKEEKLQEYEQSLKKIRLWQGGLITDQELRGKELEDKPQASPSYGEDSVIPGTSKARSEDALDSHDAENDRDLKQSYDANFELVQYVMPVPDFITHLGKTPLESPRNVYAHGVNSCDHGPEKHEVDFKFMDSDQETRGDKETESSECSSSENEFDEDPFLMLQTRRAKMQEEFRASELRRSTELDQRRKAESEEFQRRMVLASERRLELEEELQNEQKNRLATLEMEQMLQMRLFEELQRTEETNLESEKQEMEMRYRVLADLSDTYKQLEEELDMRRLDEDETVKVMLSQAIRSQENNTIFSSSGPATAEAAAESHLHCCTKVQALIRGFLCRKKYRVLRSQKGKIDNNLQIESISSEELVSGVQYSSFCVVSGDSQSSSRSQEGICSNWQLTESVKERLTNLKEAGSLQEIHSCSELAKSIGLDEESSAVEDRLHQSQDSMQNWLTQVINGWDTGRKNLQTQFEEANRLELASMYAVAEAVVFAREKEIGESLEMAVVRASRWDYYHWMCKARIMGMEDVIRNSYQGFCRRLKVVKDSLEKQTKLGTRDQYSLPLQEATSLGLLSDTRMAVKVILKRVLQFVRRAVVLVGAKSSKHNPRAQDWKTVETEGAQIGLDMRIMEYLKRSICSTRALECVKRVWVTNYNVNGAGIPYELINKRHGSVAGWDNTLVYPLTDTESELPVLSYDARLPHNPVPDLLTDALPSVDDTFRQGRKLWVMPHNWQEMVRLQSLWQQHMIYEQTSGLFSRSGSQEAKNFVSECNEPLANHDAKMRETGTNPFITGNFHDSFTLEELRGRQIDMLDTEGDWIRQKEDEHGDDDVDECHEAVVDGHDLMKQGLHSAELIAERLTTNPSKSCLTREMIQLKQNLDRKELRWVTKVDLINEGLTSLGKKGLFRWCPRLRCLSVDRNMLTSFKDVFQGGEGYLEQLSARDNSLEDLTGLEGLQNLTVLHLDGNLLSHLTAHTLHNRKEDSATIAGSTGHHKYGLHQGRLSAEVCWSRLQVLTLSCNRLTNVSQLGSLCPNLEVLDLGSNQLVTLGMGEKNALAGLQHLRVLDVGQNKLKSICLWEGLKHCPELVSLVASRNHLTELPNHFGSVLLREIWLNGNGIKQLGCKVWLPSLQRLYLQDNLITSLEPLWGCPALEVLDLSFNSISENSQLQHLSGFPNLRSLQLNDNPVSEQEDHAAYVLQAVPWLAELDNEAVSKASRDKVIATLFNNMMGVTGVTFLKEKLTRGDTLLRGFTNPWRTHKLSFNKREHNENRFGQFLNRNVWEVNDVMNGEADEASLWAILVEAKQLALSSVVFQSLLTMNAELIKLGTVRVLSDAEFEARSIMTAYQQMTHGLKGKLHAATKERCFRVSKETDTSGQHTYQRWPLNDGLTHLGPQSRSSGASVNSDRSAASHLEWCLEEHATFDPQAYTEIYKENTRYRLEAEAQIRRVTKLQALSRARTARLRVKLLMMERKEKQELEMQRSTARVQALWRGWRIRKQNILECLKAKELDRKMQSTAAIPIQALWRGYITRLKFQRALKRAKYTDDDDFDYVRIDEADFLATELALASYQTEDIYLFAVGANSANRASDTPADANCTVQDTKRELPSAKEECLQAMGIIPRTSPCPRYDRKENPKTEQKTNSVSQTRLASISICPKQWDTKQTTNSNVQISSMASTDNLKESVTDQAANFSPKISTSMASGTNTKQNTIPGAVTHSTEQSCIAAVTNIVEATEMGDITNTKEDVTNTKESFRPQTAAQENEVQMAEKILDPPMQMDQQSRDDLLKRMGFASPFPSEIRSEDLGTRETPDVDVCTTTSKRLDRLTSSTLHSENKGKANERTDSQAGDLKRKALSEDKKAAMEEIAKDWGFKNERTAEAYLKARERTTKQAKSVTQQQHLRDPEKRFKLFKAKLGGPLTTGAPLLTHSESNAPTMSIAEAKVNDHKKHIKQQVCESGFPTLGALPASNRKAASLRDNQQTKLTSIKDVPTDTKVADAKFAEVKKDSVQKDPRRVSMNKAHGELSPWHIPKLNLNSSLDAFLIRDAQDSRRSG